jgi:hypothetical protein
MKQVNVMPHLIVTYDKRSRRAVPLRHAIFRGANYV